MLNGVTKLVITKIDVLNKLKEIAAATHYNYDGGTHSELPYDLCGVEITPQLKSFKGWENSLEGVTEYEDLPATAHDFLAYLEKELETPIAMVSTGPERKKLIVRDASVVA